MVVQEIGQGVQLVRGRFRWLAAASAYAEQLAAEGGTVERFAAEL